MSAWSQTSHERDVEHYMVLRVCPAWHWAPDYIVSPCTVLPAGFWAWGFCMVAQSKMIIYPLLHYLRQGESCEIFPTGRLTCFFQRFLRCVP